MMQFKKIIDKNENNINIYMFFKKKLWNHNYLGKFLTYTKKKRKIIISTNKAMELYNYQASTYSKSSTEMKKKERPLIDCSQSTDEMHRKEQNDN